MTEYPPVVRTLYLRLVHLSAEDRQVLLVILARELAALATASGIYLQANKPAALEPAAVNPPLTTWSNLSILQAVLWTRAGGLLNYYLVPGEYAAAVRAFGEAAAVLLFERVLHSPLHGLCQCPCCGCYTLGERGGDNICKVCSWQDDDPREFFGQTAPERPQGPNHVQLEEARRNYVAFGASDPQLKELVRPPLEDELPVPVESWRGLLR